MSIISIHLTKRALDALPPPIDGKQQEYRDTTLKQLRVFRYADSCSFVFKTSHRYRSIFETLGTYPEFSIQDARDAVHTRLQQLANNVYPMGRNKTIQEIYETHYLTDAQLRKRNTQSELSKVRRHILPEFGNTPLKNLTRQTLITFQLHLSQQYKPATVNKIMSALSRMLTLAVEHGYLAQSPMTGIRQLKENNERKRILSADERGRFIAACRSLNSPASRVLELALYTGMRISEVLSVEQRHIHLTQVFLELPSTKNGRSHQVPLSEQACRVIEAQRQHVGVQRYLFPSDMTQSGHMSYPRHTFQIVCKTARIDGLCIHDLRRTFATELLQRTGDIALVAQALNHTSLNMAMRYQQRGVMTLTAQINAFQTSWS